MSFGGQVLWTGDGGVKPHISAYGRVITEALVLISCPISLLQKHYGHFTQWCSSQHCQQWRKFEVNLKPSLYCGWRNVDLSIFSCSQKLPQINLSVRKVLDNFKKLLCRCYCRTAVKFVWARLLKHFSVKHSWWGKFLVCQKSHHLYKWCTIGLYFSVFHWMHFFPTAFIFASHTLHTNCISYCIV